MAKFTGKGSAFSINTAAVAPATYVAVGQVQSIGGITISSDEVDVTTLDAGDYRQYIQGFKDPGECPLTVIFDPALADQGVDANGLLGLFASGAVKNCAVTINSSEVGGNSFLIFDAFIRDMEYGEINPDDPQTISPVFRITGPVTVVDALPTTFSSDPQSAEGMRRREAELKAKRAALEAEEEKLRRRGEGIQPVAA